MGFQNMNVEEMRNILVENFGFSQEEVCKIKGKANLAYELVKKGYNTQSDQEITHVEANAVEEIEEIEDGGFQTIENVAVDIDQTDPQWTDYVLRHFTADELFEVNGSWHPNVAGLRRVAELLLGDITFSGPVECHSTHPTTEFPLGASTVIYEIVFNWKLGNTRDSYGSVRTFRAVANANIANTDDNYAIYPDPIAETRAEGRTLRKALNLKIAAVEELTVKTVSDSVKATNSEWAGEERINSNQKAAIVTKCDAFNVDLLKFINQGDKQYSSIDEVSKEMAAKMIKVLSSYQQNNDLAKDIPESIKKEEKTQ